MGVGGFNTAQEYEYLLFTTELEPNHIIVGYNLNDAGRRILVSNDPDHLQRRVTELEAFVVDEMRQKPFLGEVSRIYKIIHQWRTSRAIEKKTIEYYHELYSRDSESWQNTKKSIAQFGAFQEKTGIPVTFIIFPRLIRLDNYPFLLEREKVIETLEANNLAYVVLSEYLTEYKGPELWVHPTDQHPNEVVHRVAAEALVEKLLKLGF